MAVERMRAVRVHEWGAPPIVETVATPSISDGESLVRIEAAAVAHLDRTVAGGDFDLKPQLPYIGGVEGCGVVEESDDLTPGTRVMLRGGGLGLTRDGTWAEYAVARSRHLSPLPASMAPELGATYFVPVTTAAVALRSLGQLGSCGIPEVDGPGDEVVVVGGAAGAVGSMVAQLAVRDGARVLGLVAEESQAARLPEGVEPVVASDHATATELTEDRPASLLVDTLGGQGLADRSRWVRPGGRVVSIGYVTGTEVTLDLPNWLLQDVALLPLNMIRRDREARLLGEELAPLVAAGDLHLEVENFEFQEAQRALELLGSGGLRGRAVLVPSREVR